MFLAGGRGLVLLGVLVIVALFVIYGRYQDSELLTPSAIGAIQRIASGFYITLAAAVGMLGLGTYRYHKQNAANPGLSGTISGLLLSSRSKRIFVAVFAIYGIFFSLASGTLVYQPEINFATHYGAAIPSGFIAPCCDDPGYMPKMIIYLTEHVGLQVIPINLILQITVSYLVALNAAIAAGAYHASKKGRGLGTVGAVTGLFIACPTCAGTLLSAFAGTASGIALSVALAQMQTIFIAVSIPVLVATPFLLARRLNPAGCIK